MLTEGIYTELKKLVDSLNISIRYINSDYQPGLLKLNGKLIILLDCKDTLEEKCRLIALSLSEFGIGEMYLKPAIRDYIETVSQNDVK